MPIARATALVILCLSLAACWGGGSAISPNAYAGPRMQIRPLEGRHLLVVDAPNPGWLVTVDRTERRLDDTQIFVSLRRPDPGMVYAQVMVEQKVLTTVPETRDIVVYARTLDFGRKNQNPPYHRVALDASIEGRD